MFHVRGVNGAWLGIVWLSILLANFSLRSHAAETADAHIEDRNYQKQIWKAEQGLPNNTVQALLQTRDGYLWIGTRAGLARFDGVKFTVFNSQNTPALHEDSCTALAEDIDGNLWIGTADGVMRYEAGSFTRFTKADNLTDNSILSLCASQSGGVWIGTENGLDRFQDGRIRRYTTADGLSERLISAVFDDQKGTLWIGGKVRLVRHNLKSGSFADVQLRDETQINPAETHPIGSVQADRAGDLWIASSVLYRLRENEIIDFSKSNKLLATVDRRLTSWVASIRSDMEGHIWLGLRFEGLLRLETQPFKVTRFGIQDGLSEDRVLCLLEDREGSLWIGTEFGGLNRWRPANLTTFTTRDGLVHDWVRTLCESRVGSLWIGTEEGVSRFKDGSFRNYTDKKELTANVIRSLAEDQNENVWIGHLGFGVDRLRGEQAENFRFGSGEHSNVVRVVYPDRAGNLWVGTKTGLHRMKDGHTVTYTMNDGLSTNEVRSVLETRDGTLWLATFGGGLNRFYGGTFSAYRVSDGLSSDFTWTLHEDAEGALWIGTDRGLNRFRDGRFTSFKRREGLIDDEVNQVLDDDFGNLWLASKHGIYRVRKRDLDAVAEGRSPAVNAIVYGEADGMVSSETTGHNTQPAGCKTRDGKLWFCTTRGVVRIDPAKVKRNDLPPPVVIEQVRANLETVFGDGAPRDLPEAEGGARRSTRAAALTWLTPWRARSDTPHPLRQVQSSDRTTAANLKLPTSNLKLHLSPGRGRVLEFQYTANSFVAPEKVRFKYRLDGWDDDWIDAGARRIAYYTNLRPGDYRFRVIAANNHGVWNETGASLALHLAPHFYQTWWFRFLCGGVVLLIAYSFFRWKINNERRLQLLEKKFAVADERKRIAQDMHDQIGAQLTQFTLASELAEEQTAPAPAAVDPTTKPADLARAVVRSLDEIVWATEPAKDTLESLAAYVCQYVKEFLTATPMRLRLKIPERIPAHPLAGRVRHNLFLAVKEALNNAVKHSSATEIFIGLKLSAASFELLIEDNGCGFSAINSQFDGNGLSNMRERIQDAGGKFTLESEAGRGTKIKIEMALEKLDGTK